MGNQDGVRKFNQSAKLVLQARDILGEEPLWHSNKKTLYWVDTIVPGALRSFRPQDEYTQSWSYDRPLFSLALRLDGDLLIAGRKDIYTWSEKYGLQERLCMIEPDLSENRINCMACDPLGNLWVATMQDNVTPNGEPKDITGYFGALYRVDLFGKTKKIAEGFACPNTMVWSPDGVYFYMGDSATGWIYRYNFDCEYGKIGKREYFFRAPDIGIPDGSAMDRDGYIWNARWGANCVLRISPHGQVVQRVDVAARQPTCLVFGGEQQKTLYITTACFGMNELGRASSNGGLFSFEADVGGGDIYCYRG